MTADEGARYTVRQPADRRTDPIDWDTVTDEELVERAQVFSFTIREMRKRVGNRENWIKIIVAYLYIDHILTSLIEDNMVDATAYNNKNRRKYLLDKLDVCQAMGWVDPNKAKIVVSINSIRNSLAHTLNFQLTDKAVRDLKNAFPPAITAIFMKDDNGKAISGKRFGLSHYLEALIVVLDIDRQNVLLRKYRRRKYEINLRAAMENARRVLREVDEGKYRQPVAVKAEKPSLQSPKEGS